MFIVNWFFDILAQLGTAPSVIFLTTCLRFASRLDAQECQNSFPWIGQCWKNGARFSCPVYSSLFTIPDG